MAEAFWLNARPLSTMWFVPGVVRLVIWGSFSGTRQVWSRLREAVTTTTQTRTPPTAVTPPSPRTWTRWWRTHPTLRTDTSTPLGPCYPSEQHCVLLKRKSTHAHSHVFLNGVPIQEKVEVLEHWTQVKITMTTLIHALTENQSIFLPKRQQGPELRCIHLYYMTCEILSANIGRYYTGQQLIHPHRINGGKLILS